jgi:hypothetical protein
MILSKIVNVTLNPANIKHYESLGYTIPKIKQYQKMIIPRGTTIKVKISDLSKGCNAKIFCECDKCHIQRKIRFCDYTHLCQKCNHIKYKGGLPFCQYCGKQLNRYDAKCCIKCKGKNLTGKNNPNYNHNLTKKDRQYKRTLINPWKRKVKQRDNYTCQKCNFTKHLCAHHINNYANFKEQRYDINNGITLCKICHKQIHSIYGLKTTRKDLNKFI